MSEPEILQGSLKDSAFLVQLLLRVTPERMKDYHRAEVGEGLDEWEVRVNFSTKTIELGKTAYKSFGNFILTGDTRVEEDSPNMPTANRDNNYGQTQIFIPKHITDALGVPIQECQRVTTEIMDHVGNTYPNQSISVVIAAAVLIGAVSRKLAENPFEFNKFLEDIRETILANAGIIHPSAVVFHNN